MKMEKTILSPPRPTPNHLLTTEELNKSIKAKSRVTNPKPKIRSRPNQHYEIKTFPNTLLPIQKTKTKIMANLIVANLEHIESKHKSIVKLVERLAQY